MAHGDEKSTETIEGLLSDLETPNRFSPEQLRTFTSNFSTSLGSGGFGDVYKGTLHDGVQVAVKVLKGALLSDGVEDLFKAEVSIHGKIHHKYVVKLYGFCFEQNMKALVYEFMENGSLDKLLYGNQSIAWETLCNIAVGTAKGLAYLHEGCQQIILHYDVKPANILLDSKFSPKVGDFGLAKRLNQETTHITESRIRGTSNYMAPELLMRNSWITHKCDVFSFGISLFDIIGRRKHIQGEGEKWFPVQVWKKFKEEKQEEIMQECGIQEKQRKPANRILLIALQCVQFSAGDRPSMSRVVRLLEGTEKVKLPPNPFLYMDSSSAVTKEDENDNISHTTLGPWGKDGGRLWDDGIFAGIGKINVFEVKEFKIMTVQVEYYGTEYESFFTSMHVSGKHVYTIATIELDYPSEYLMRVTGFYGDTYDFYKHRTCGTNNVKSLCFFTNKKIYGPFGYDWGTYFTSENDGRVVGFHGRHGRSCSAIGVHMEYDKDRQMKLKVSSIKLTTVGPWGGEEGVKWDDGVPYGIKRIDIYIGVKGYVQSMQIWYCGNDGAPIWSVTHGSISSDLYLRDTIELDYPSEHLVRVTGFHGYGRFYGFGFGEEASDLVRSLCFFSNKKKYGPFGKVIDYSGLFGKLFIYFSTENRYGKDGKVMGFYGRSHRGFLSAIGVHMDGVDYS